MKGINISLIAILFVTITFFTGCGDSGKSISKPTSPTTSVEDNPVQPTATPIPPTATPIKDTPTPTPTPTNSGNTGNPLPF
jgi:hypothetical protein